jgi:hypothetical protein
MLNIVEVVPIANANVKIATAVWLGFFESVRKACLRVFIFPTSGGVKGQANLPALSMGQFPNPDQSLKVVYFNMRV